MVFAVDAERWRELTGACKHREGMVGRTDFQAERRAFTEEEEEEGAWHV